MLNEQEDSVKIVTDVLYAFSAGAISEDEMNLRIHDKRYHPHGFKEGETCKYRLDAPDSEIRKHYAELSKGISVSEMENALKSKFGATIIFATQAEHLESHHGFNEATASWIRDCMSPMSRDIHNKNIRTLFEVCADIQKRHPNFRLMNPKVISWEVQEHVEEYRAVSELDERNVRRTNFMAFGDYYSSQRVQVPRYHIFRHEIGHDLATWEILGMWEKLRDSYSSKTEFKEMVAAISGYAKTNDEEAIAEAFAIYTAPGYIRGLLPRKLEDIIEEMMKSTPKSKESSAMDSLSHSPRKGVEPIDDVYYMSLDDFKVHPEISWHDNKKGVVKFNTYEEKLRYALRCYKVPEDWIERFIQEFPGRKWDGMDISEIQYDYRETNKTLDEIIKFYKRWFG